MNTIILFIRMFVLTIINLYTVRLVLNGLGVVDYGIFNAVAGVVTTTSFIISILEMSIQRFYSVYLGKNDIKTLHSVFSISFKLTIILAIIVLILFETGGLWFISNKLNVPSSRMVATYHSFHFSLFAFIFTFIQIPFSAAIFSHEDMNIYAIISSVDCFLKLGIALLIGKTAFDNLSFYSAGLLVVAIITFLNYSLYGHYKYKECSYIKTKDKKLTKELLSFSSWTMFGSISKVCMIQGSTILLNVFFGPIANAAFAISMQINNAFNALCNSMVLAIRPVMIKAYSNNDNEYLYKTFSISNKFILYILLAVSFPMIANMDIIMRLWLHEVTLQTILFAKLTIIYIIVLALNNPITIIIQASGNIKKYFLCVESISLLCLPISYIAFKLNLPAEWIFYSMTIVCIVAHIVRLHCLKEIFNLFDYKVYIREFCIPASLIIICGIVLLFTLKYFFMTNQAVHFFTTIICLPIFVLGSAYIIGLNRNEKSIAIKLIKSRKIH